MTRRIVMVRVPVSKLRGLLRAIDYLLENVEHDNTPRLALASKVVSAQARFFEDLDRRLRRCTSLQRQTLIRAGRRILRRSRARAAAQGGRE